MSRVSARVGPGGTHGRASRPRWRRRGRAPAPPPLLSLAVPLARRDVDVARAGPTLGSADRAGTTEEKLLAMPGERGSGFARARVDGSAHVDRWRPRICGAVARRGVDVLAAQRVRAVRREHHLSAVLPDVRLDVVGGCRRRSRAAELADERRRTERAVCALGAPVDIARDEPALRGDARAREVQLPASVRLEVGRALLVERCVWPDGRAGEVLRVAPAVGRVESAEVDVAEAAREAGDNLPADEEESLAAYRRWTEVVRRGVDRRGEVHGRSPRLVDARAVRDPDVEESVPAGPVGRHVEAEPIRRLDRAAVERRGVQLGAVPPDLVDLLR